MLDRLRPYIDADDMPGAALLSMHVLVDAVRRWVDPEVLAMLPPVNPPGAVTDSDQVLDALPLGIGCVSGVLLVAFGLSSLRRREGARMPRVAAGVAMAGPETVGADADSASSFRAGSDVDDRRVAGVPRLLPGFLGRRAGRQRGRAGRARGDVRSGLPRQARRRRDSCRRRS